MKTFSTVVGKYPHTDPLTAGTVSEQRVGLDFIWFDPVWDASDTMCDDQEFDICELAIVTYLQAIEAGVPLMLLPVVMLGGIHHRQLWSLPDRADLDPKELAGRCVGIRAHSQTTVMWVRGILSEEYGVDPRDITWITTEAPHVADFVEPPNVRRAPHGKSLPELLAAGEIVAVIGSSVGVPEAVPLIRDHKAAATAWYERHGTVAINHMIALKAETFRDDPVAVRAVYGLFCSAIAMASEEEVTTRGGVPSAVRVGFENVRSAIELAQRYSHDQGLISDVVPVETLFPAYLL